MSAPTHPSFAFGRFHYDGKQGRLLLDGREVPLPPRELHLLAIFLVHPSEWLGEEWLERGLWPKAVPPTGELGRLVRELTAVLDGGADGVATIQRATGRGYRWLFPLGEVIVGSAEPESGGPRAPSDLGRDRASTLSGSRSAHRILLSPRRLAIGLLAAFVLAAALFWAERAVSRRAASSGEGRTDASDPAALSAAAAAELASGVVAARGHDLASRRVAIARFEAALALDPLGPGQAAAHAALASTLVLEGDLARARREARAALRLDAALPEAYAVLSLTQLLTDFDLVAARASAERALALNVAHTGGRRALAWVDAVEGRFVVALSQLALTRSPAYFDPEVATDEGSILYLSGRALEARRQLTEVVRREPAFRRAHAALAELHLAERRLGAAAFELELLDALVAGATREDERFKPRAEGAWMPPDAGEAARRLEARAERVHLQGAAGSELEAARIFARFGQRDLAIAALERALDRRENGAALARIDPAFFALRDQTAFRELLEKAGVPAVAISNKDSPHFQ